MFLIENLPFSEFLQFGDSVHLEPSVNGSRTQMDMFYSYKNSNKQKFGKVGKLRFYQQTYGARIIFPIADQSDRGLVIITTDGIRDSGASESQDNCECQAGHDTQQDKEDGTRKNHGQLERMITCTIQLCPRYRRERRHECFFTI